MIYEYGCEECEVVFEMRHSASESRKGRRHSCGKEAIPLISMPAPAFRFRPYVEENLGADPVVITSAKELETIAESRGLRVHGAIPGKRRFTKARPCDWTPGTPYPAPRESGKRTVVTKPGATPER